MMYVVGEDIILPPKIVQNKREADSLPYTNCILSERYLRLPLTRELSPKVTEGEKSIGITAILVSPSVFCLRQNPPPSSDGGGVSASHELTAKPPIFYLFTFALIYIIIRKKFFRICPVFSFPGGKR